MALIVADRVQETTNSTGTGAYTLGGAVPGFQTFASEVSNADTVYYSITDNVDFEVGLGTYASSGGTITRTTVFTSSNSNSAVNWGIGTKNIFLTYPADKAVVEDASNNVTIGNNLVVGGTVDGRDVAADGTKLDFVTVTQAVNLDQMETDIAALENGMVYKGDWNAGSGSFPGSGSAQTGWFYYVSGAGTVNGISFAVGDNIVATTDNASTSTYASNWSKHDQTDAVQAVVGLTGSIAKGSLLSALNVEDGADVTDTANVTSAGALMDSEVTNLAQVKAFNSSDYATAAQGTTANNALPKAGGTMSGDIDGNGNKVLFANVYSQLSDLPSASTYHGMFAHVHATGKAYFAHSGAWVPLANESTTLALAGGTMTGDVLYNDNIKAKFGAGSDLQIYHDASNSYVADQGTGQLVLLSNSFRINNAANTENMISAEENGAVSLFFNDSSKLATTSTGVQVSGNISNATGDFTLDVAGNISLDADGGVIRFFDGSAEYGRILKNSNDFQFESQIDDGDIVFKGQDGTSLITALTLDMSAAGAATFNSSITSGGNITVGGTNNLIVNDSGAAIFGNDGDLSIGNSGVNGLISAPNGDLTLDASGVINIDADNGGNINLKDGGTHYGTIQNENSDLRINSIIQDKDIIFRGNDGGTGINALTLDMSNGGKATFNNGATSNGDISLGDNKYLLLGNANDLQIYHDGSNSYIKNNTGWLNMPMGGSGLTIANSNFTENLAKFVVNGAIELYHNGSKKFETTSSGVTVTGDISNASGSMTIDVGASLRLDSGAGEIELREAGTVFGNFAKTGNDFRINQSIQDGDIVFRGNDGGSIITALTLDMSNAGAATFNNAVTATTFNGDGSNLTGIPDNNTTYSAGNGLGLAGTTFNVNGDQRGNIVYIGRDNNDYIGVETTAMNFVLDGNVDMKLENDGDLHVDGNVVAYSTTTSDERLKKDIVKIDNALDKVSQLSGYTFEYKADGKKSAGVIAQEVEKVMPSAVSETTLPLKMGEDDKTEYKTVQYDQLHGLMIEAIKELKAEIEELKAR